MYGASHVSRAFAGGWTLLARSLCYLNSKHFKEEEERYCTLPRFNPFFPPSLPPSCVHFFLLNPY